VAMFEAIHGSAPRRAGQNLANPSGLFLGSILMLVHIGQPDVAALAHNAWMKTIEDGIHTYDIYTEGVSKEKVGTKEFAEAVVARLGQKPEKLKPAEYKAADLSKLGQTSNPAPQQKELVGVDVYLDWSAGSANDLGATLSALNGEGLKLATLNNRGMKVWPDGSPETFCSDHWRCRFTSEGTIKHEQITNLLNRVSGAGLDYIKTENLYTFDGKAGYSV
jgi:isocitrate dehydrogenase